MKRHEILQALDDGAVITRVSSVGRISKYWLGDRMVTRDQVIALYKDGLIRLTENGNGFKRRDDEG